MTDDLDGFFAAARAAGPAPSEALVARVLADAEAAMPRAVAPAPEAPAPRRRWLAAVAALFGGGPMAAGLASAVVAGVAIGYAGPVTSDWLAGAVSGGAEIRMMAASDLFLGEG